MKTVHFTKKFPSISHPVYAEVRNDQGHIVYWNAYHTEDEMKAFMEKLFSKENVIFTDMR